MQELSDALPFLDIGMMDPDWSFTITMARQLASVKNQRLEGITVDSLRAECQQNGVEFTEEDETLRFRDQGLQDLLDVLDRRRFVDGLVPGDDARYKANSRQRLI